MLKFCNVFLDYVPVTMNAPDEFDVKLVFQQKISDSVFLAFP